jgi:hypothetical protein
MRKWGVIITLFYIAVLAVVILPLAFILSGFTASTVLWEWYPWPWTPGTWIYDSEILIPVTLPCSPLPLCNTVVCMVDTPLND